MYYSYEIYLFKRLKKKQRGTVWLLVIYYLVKCENSTIEWRMKKYCTLETLLFKIDCRSENVSTEYIS